MVVSSSIVGLYVEMLQRHYITGSQYSNHKCEWKLLKSQCLFTVWVVCMVCGSSNELTLEWVLNPSWISVLNCYVFAIILFIYLFIQKLYYPDPVIKVGHLSEASFLIPCSNKYVTKVLTYCLSFSSILKGSRKCRWLLLISMLWPVVYYNLARGANLTCKIIVYNVEAELYF